MPDRCYEGRHVLVVEDEYFLADDLRQALEDRGAHVLGPMATVEDSVKIVESDLTIDAALLDINLGGQMSYPVAEALIARDVPFVFTTGYNDDDVPGRYGAIRNVQKPAAPRQVLKALAEIMPSL